jgi:hypothetical protein
MKNEDIIIMAIKSKKNILGISHQIEKAKMNQTMSMN